MATCRHCGYEGPELATCPLCGTASAPAEGLARKTGDPRIPEWEDSGHPFPKNLLDTWRRSVFSPGEFFRDVPYERPAARPILYYVLVSVVSSLVMLWWSPAFSTLQIPLLGETMAASELLPFAGATAASAAFNFFLAPFVAIISLTLWSLLLHLFVLMLARQRRSLTATVRAVCYAAGPSLLVIVPVLGALVGGVWTLVLTVIGIREAHRMTTGAAVAAMLMAIFVPLVVLFVLILILAAAVASIGF